MHRIPAERAGEGLYDADAICDALSAQDHVPLDRIARDFAPLADRTKLRILVSLLQIGELCVADLAVVSGLSVSATSHALRELSARSMVTVRRDGRRAFYRATDSPYVAFLRSLLADLPARAHRHHRHVTAS